MTNKKFAILSIKICEALAEVNRRRGVNPRRDRLKLDNCVTRAMQDVMKLVRVASNRHLRNWEAPDALVQEIIPGRVERAVGKVAPWPHRRYGSTSSGFLHIYIGIEITMRMASY